MDFSFRHVFKYFTRPDVPSYISSTTPSGLPQFNTLGLCHQTISPDFLAAGLSHSTAMAFFPFFLSATATSLTALYVQL